MLGILQVSLLQRLSLSLSLSLSSPCLKSVVYAKSRSVVNSACSATPTSNLFVGVALIIVCTAV